MEVSVVIPCLNEEKSVGTCVEKAFQALKSLGISGEVIVVDNGSQDRSVEVAKSAGARLVLHAERGYGSATLRGIRESRGTLVIMGDADETYDFSEIPQFIKLLQEGVDFVIGNRFSGRVGRKAMPLLHRLLGTPILNWLLRIFFHAHFSDLNCGFRAFRKGVIEQLNLKCTGMEFASEMLIRIVEAGLSIKEIPISYHPGPFGRRPHLRTFQDGWRHLRLMLVLCPRYLFFIPGIVLSLLGLILLNFVYFTEIRIFHMSSGLSTAVFANALLFMGIQITLFGIYSMILNRARGIATENGITRFFQNHFTLEAGLILGGFVLASGVFLGFTTACLIFKFANNLPYVHIPLARLAIFAIFTCLIGIQALFSSFYIGLLNLDKTLK
ncbi:MAG: hypothetical protein A3G87_08695 [Omnitrophica bacterium RIFCSPLOWO2_12_FULL_50_11]|nr:MAG: hypothetical protein A3G87_08695 [Omnitrophica bacterium RIFCSPLOWO2_12_FULL_50_11]